MYFFKLAILSTLFIFSSAIFARPEEVKTLPSGKWKLVKITEDASILPLQDMTLYAYKNRIALFEVRDEKDTCYRVSNQNDHLELEIPHYCDDEEFDIDEFFVRNNELEIVEGDMHYFFSRDTVSPIRYQDLTAVWEMQGADAGESYLAVIYPDRQVSLTVIDGSDALSGRVAIDESGLPYIVADYIFIPILFGGDSFDVLAGEQATFRKTSKLFPSRFILDGNGLAAEIEKFSVTTKINDGMAETSLDIQFKTLSDRQTEVALKLPLPASASVTGYSLDVNKKMIPAVVVPKETAREALETLESRGVDPAIAELTQNNLFQTEIYPVSKNDPRRITIQYHETLQKVNGEYRYSLPLELLGTFRSFSFEIEVDANVSVKYSPNSAIKKDQIRDYKTSKNTKILRFNTSDFSSDSEFSLNLQPNVKPGLQVQLAKDNQIFFRLPLKIESRMFTPENILILWDTSLSMQAYHAQYTAWLNKIRQQFPEANLTVQPFSTSIEKPVYLSSSKKTDLAPLELIYDGASNLNIIKDFIQAQRKETILLFSDAVHSVGLLDLTHSAVPLFAVYPDSKTSNMPLLESLAVNGNLASLKDLSSKSLTSFFSLLDEAYVKNKNDDLIVTRQFGDNQAREIIGKLNKSDLPYTLSVEINNVKKEFTIDSEKPVAGSNFQYLWARAKIHPLLNNPQQNKQVITDIGVKYSVVTPYTSFLVLEDIHDYVEFGVKPPSVFDPENRYKRLRRYYLADQVDDKKKAVEKLLDDWQVRVNWYKDPVAFNRKILKPQKSGIEEVMVTGMRASVLRGSDQMEEVVIANDIGQMNDKDLSGIKIAAWNPDTPYLNFIKNVPLSEAYAAYLQKRKEHGTNLSFYMDVAKYFFDQQQYETGYKILSNISERMPEKILAQRMLAYCLMEYRQWNLALFYLNFVNEIVPYESTSKRDLAVLFENMASAQKPEFAIQSANNYWQAILLDDSFVRDLALISLGEINHLIEKWKIDPEKISQFDKRFIAPMEMDLRVVISWTNNQADMDLHMLEPDGTKVFYGKRYSLSGGWLPFDNTSGFGPEEYLLKKAKKGSYKVKANFYSNDSVEAYGPVTARVDIYRHYGSENEVHKITTIRIDEDNQDLDLAEIMID